jgi:hypothetical protein
MPTNFARADHILIWKNKPAASKNDLSAYRPIAILEHAFKLLELVVLKRLTSEVGLVDRDGDGAVHVGDNQNGFRSRSSCRDELLIVSIWIQKAIAFQAEEMSGGYFHRHESHNWLHRIVAAIESIV